MATAISKGGSSRPEQQRWTFSKKFNWNYFVQDNLTGSRALLIWVISLVAVTLLTLIFQFGSAPGRTGVIFGVWAFFVGSTVVGELFTAHTGWTRWLKENMFNTVSNAVITLFLSLMIGLVTAAFWQWGYVDATFSPDTTAPDLRSTGATWGVLWGAKKLLATGLLDPVHNWRVLSATGLILALWLSSYVTSRESLKDRLKPLATVTNILWALSPFAIYIFLVGIDYTGPLVSFSTMMTGVVVALALMGLLWFFKVIQLTPVSIAIWVLAWPIGYLVWRLIGQTGIFQPIDVDELGGLLLTVIFAIFVNFLSLPIGVFLALGRRADVQGIPWWIIWPVAIFFSGLFFFTSTPELWETSRNNIERLLALWPALILIVAFYFQRSFNGNFVQAFSVLFIEIIRGVPLITLLFMAIVMAPFFAAEGSTGLKSFWAVIIGYTIFSSAYMAELVRGGLQAIPKGQYEASDALGFNTLQKYRFIVLPQALRILIPPLTGSVIGTFKSSSLVALVGMIDLVGATRAIIANTEWLGLRTELYVFMFVLYFLVSSVVSAYSRRLEERTGLGVR